MKNNTKKTNNFKKYECDLLYFADCTINNKYYLQSILNLNPIDYWLAILINNTYTIMAIHVHRFCCRYVITEFVASVYMVEQHKIYTFVFSKIFSSNAVCVRQKSYMDIFFISFTHFVSCVYGVRRVHA